MITHASLLEILHYSIITGQFYRLKSKQGVKAGDDADYLRKDGYVRIEINRKKYLAHRLAWFWVTGEWPKSQIDHKNGIKDANQWLNIREATRSQNMQNRCLNLSSTSGHKGVTWHKSAQKWQAQIGINGKNNYLGLFDCIELAYAERLKAEKDLHGVFARQLGKTPRDFEKLSSKIEA